MVEKWCSGHHLPPCWSRSYTYCVWGLRMWVGAMKGTVVVRIFLWRITGPCNKTQDEGKQSAIANNSTVPSSQTWWSLAESYDKQHTAEAWFTLTVDMGKGKLLIYIRCFKLYNTCSVIKMYKETHLKATLNSPTENIKPFARAHTVLVKN